MAYNKRFINLACLVFTEKCRAKKTSVRYFSVKTLRSVNKKLLQKLPLKNYCADRQTHTQSDTHTYKRRRQQAHWDVGEALHVNHSIMASSQLRLQV
jgi:hypothetical protein